MSGPYNYGFRPPHGQSPLSPETPTSAYKIDVKRTKTKKWVEAKTQNYDGDDWGNDFDEEPEEPVPVPTLKPTTGFRQPSPSQATTANLPSNQPLTPQTAEPVPMMRPQQPAANNSVLSSSPRATVGLPPLQIQTQPRPAPPVAHPESNQTRPQIVSGPSSMDSVSDKGPYEHLVSPQSANTGPAAAAFVGHHEPPRSITSPVGARRTSPAPPQQPAQPQATRFPPRKSSMGQHDADRQASSRSNSTQPPWMEQRSRSPSTVRSPGTSSTAKAQPFVRPADIYRRAENDKDKERRSAESRRPSLDSAGVPRTDRSISPANVPVGVGADEQVRGRDLGLSKPQVEDAPQAPGKMRPILEPVAERKSEYGFDRLLPHPQSQAQPSANITSTSSGSPQLALHAPAPAPEPQLQRPTNEEAAEQRRYSSSPRLPDLARMSLFGDDFFSNPGKFADEAPPMPSLPSQQPGAAGPAGNLSTMDESATPAALSTSSSTPQPVEPPLAPNQSDKKESASSAQPSPSKENTEPVGLGLASQPSRPSLPGGWVTETRSVTDEQTPSASAEKKTSGLDSGEVSPITDNEDDELRGNGVVAVKDRVSIPISIPGTSKRVSESHDWDPDKADAAINHPAPLNPRASDNSPSDVVSPEKLQRVSTMSTVTSPSPVKESDKLREEIMRSLSPVRPTSDFKDFDKDRASGLTVEEDNGPRGSTYLHGVYDDYWTAGDDKPDLPEFPKSELDVAKSAGKNISGVPPLSPFKEATGTPPKIGRRFSWEAELEKATPGPADPQKNLSPEPQTAAAGAVSSSPLAQHPEHSQPVSSEEPKDAVLSQPPTIAADETHIAVPPNSGTVSHQVSQVGSVPRDRLGSDVIEPPSPVSVATDKNNASVAPIRRLSLAEEKSMDRVSSNPVSPSPSPGDHPALAQSSDATPPPASPEPSLQQAVAPVKITNFRDIMELQSASERINKYNETRAHFAAMDSGLDNWLATLRSQHPEHANTTASYATNISNAGQGQSSSTASQSNSQQPYYQQYLNASSTNVSTAAVTSGRPPAGSVSMGSHSPSSDFKHSSGQVGAKGKGLLLAAGKAGKGLLSKGKNKLRGTGDKNDSSPPTVQTQTKAKAERSTSWGIGLGSRSSPRANSHAYSASFSGSLSGPAPSPQTTPEHPASLTPQPELPQTSCASPFDALTQDKRASAWAPPRPQTPKHCAGAPRDSDSEPVSPVSDTHSVSAWNDHGKNSKEAFDSGVNSGDDLQVPRPISKARPSWDPLTGTPLVEEEVFDLGHSRDPSPHAHLASRAPAGAQAQFTSSAKDSTNEDDWVVVSSQSPPSAQVYVVSREPPPLARSFQPIEACREVSAKEDEEGESAVRDVVPEAQQAQQAHQQLQYHVERQQPGQQDVPAAQFDQSARHISQQGNGYQAPLQAQFQHQSAQHQTRKQLPSQQQQRSPQRQSSFVGLPPIRRTSTFGVNLTRRAKKRFSLDEDDDNSHVFASSPIGTAGQFGPGTSNALQGRQSEGDSVQSEQPARAETGLLTFRKDSATSNRIVSATSTQAATLATESTGVDWRVDDEKRPLDPQHSFRPGGPNPAPIDTRLAMQHDGRTGGQALAPGMRSQMGMVSPTVGGNPIQHLPPQGPWKLEESHLSEPLLPASRNRLSGSSTSPYQPSFGFDKETGVPSPTAQLPPRQKSSDLPPSSAQRYPELFTSPPQGYLNSGSPTGPRTPHDLGHQYYSRDDTSLQRARTVDSEVSSVEPSGDDEWGRKKRGSGFFKEVGGRFSRTSSKERQNLKDKAELTGYPADSSERERLSVSSIATGDLQDRQRRRSSFFLNLGRQRLSDAEVAGGQGAEGISPSPRASPNPGSSPQLQQSGGLAERKRSWLGPAANDSSAALPNLSRSSTSTAANEQAEVKAPPKKRLSNLSKIFNRTSSQQDLQSPQKPGTSHSVVSSFQSPYLGNQLRVSGSQVTLGRERSNTTGSGPFGLLQTNKQLQAAGEDDRGRRSSASGFLSGLFGTNSTKPQEVQQPAGAAPHQVSPQFKMQQSRHHHHPSNLGPNRYMAPPHMREPTQQVGSQPPQQLASQGWQVPGAGPQLQPPAPHLEQPPRPTTYDLADAGARPVSEIESEDQNVFIRDGSGAASQQIVHDQHLPRASPRVQDSDFPRSTEVLSRQSLPVMSHLSNQEHTSPTVPQSREEPTQPVRRQDSSQPQENFGSVNDVKDQLPVRSRSGRVQVADPQKPPLSQSHALGIHGPDGHRRDPSQAASLQAPSHANGLVNESDMSQRSSISASPQQPNAVQFQPPIAAAAVDRQILVDNSLRRQVGPFGTGGLRQSDQMSRQPFPSVPSTKQWQTPAPMEGGSSQFSQPSPHSTQRSSPPHFLGQGHDQKQDAHPLKDQGPKNAVSKWLRNRSSNQAAEPQSQQGHTKESTAKALFSAFKRASKQAEPRPQPALQPDQRPHMQSIQMRSGQQLTPPPGPLNHRAPLPMQGSHINHQKPSQSLSAAASMGQRPPPQHDVSSASSEIPQVTGQILQHRRPLGEPVMTRTVPSEPNPVASMPTPQPYQEPQYDQVPIPRGYAAVHGEGGIAPSPFDIGRPSPPAQYPRRLIPPTQQHWDQPSFSQGEPLMHGPSRGPSPQFQPQGQKVQEDTQHAASQQVDRRISSTSHHSHVSNASHGSQPTFVGPIGAIHQHQSSQDPGPARLAYQHGSANDQIRHDPRGDPQVNSQVYVEPQGQRQLNNEVLAKVSRQAQPFTQHRPCPAKVSEQKAAPSQGQPSHGEGLRGSSEVIPQGEHVQHDGTSQPTRNEPSTLSDAQALPQGLAIVAGSVAESNPRSMSPAAQIVVDGVVGPNPPALAVPQSSINVQDANQESSDDIYDFTPRLPWGPPPPPAQPVTATKTGQSLLSESSADEAPRNAKHTNVKTNGNGNGSTTLSRGKSTRAELEDTEDERMRTMRLEAQEEKILADPYEEKQSSGNKYRKEDDPEAPQMTATSYPGQEWSPYGAGSYEDLD